MRYLFTAYVVVLLIVVLPPVWIVLMVLPRGRWSGVALRWCARMLIAGSGCRCRITGAHRLHASLPAVIVVNHSSYLDSVVLIAVLPVECRFVANHRLARIPLIGRAIHQAGYLTVNRGRLKARARCLSDMIQTVRAGASLVVYPEATTSRTGELLPFKLGAFRVAMETQRPLVPITIAGTARVWPRDSWLMRPGAIDVYIHDRIETASTGRTETARLRAQARATIQSAV